MKRLFFILCCFITQLHCIQKYTHKTIQTSVLTLSEPFNLEKKIERNPIQVTYTVKFSEDDKNRIRIWLQNNSLNQFADHKNTMYPGGTAFFSENNKKQFTDKFAYIATKLKIAPKGSSDPTKNVRKNPIQVIGRPIKHIKYKPRSKVNEFPGFIKPSDRPQPVKKKQPVTVIHRPGIVPTMPTATQSNTKRTIEDCSICIDKLVGLLYILKCSHSHHLNCIRGWIAKPKMNLSQCPLCRTTITANERNEILGAIKNPGNQQTTQTEVTSSGFPSDSLLVPYGSDEDIPR